MKIYHLKRSQLIPIKIEEAWAFFSEPGNLSRITPGHMGFKMLYISGSEQAYAGQIIRYKIKILPGISVHWVTEITQLKKPDYFVDEQRFGPYALWHHQHHFKQVDGGVEVTDEVNYAIPFGLLGRLAQWVFVGREVKAIFNHRKKMLTEIFKQETEKTVQ